MNLEEHAAKRLVLDAVGIPTLPRRLCATADEAAEAFAAIGPCVVKAQVPAGKRGKAGGIGLADDAAAAGEAARAILGMAIGGYRVERVLLEARAAITRELYAAVLPDAAARAPLVLFSAEGGMEIEDLAATRPSALRRHLVDLDSGFDLAAARRLVAGLGAVEGVVAEILVKLYRAFREKDAELVEINPLAVLADGRVVALDCKFTLDDAAAFRQKELAAAATPEKLSALERRGAEAGLRFIELPGNVGILANGAGLTMTTMDAISHFGGQPANFLEIGGEAYTKGETALSLVLANPGVRSLVVNFCGAFARCDVMAEGVIAAWETLKPRIPVFFSIHGTGEAEAIHLVRARLGLEPFDLMEDAVKAAVEAAR
jgi:succinyl-CoA synthetase beta subunit